MRRTGFMSLMAMVGLALAGCGSSDGTGGPASSLVGTWELVQKSDDGGTTFDDVSNDFTFTFNTDGTWSDSDGDGGTWTTSGGLVTVSHTDGSSTEYFIWRLESNGGVLRLTIANFQGTATQDISLYAKIR